MAAAVTAASLIITLTSLCQQLPSSIPKATKDGWVYHVVTSVNEDDPWQSFNHKFDLLFGEDCHNQKGHLHNIRCGKYGMGVVCTYLKGINTEEPWFLTDLVAIKLDHICKEVIKLKYYSP
jgi:hypothetical protein